MQKVEKQLDTIMFFTFFVKQHKQKIELESRTKPFVKFF